MMTQRFEGRASIIARRTCRRSPRLSSDCVHEIAKADERSFVALGPQKVPGKLDSTTLLAQRQQRLVTKWRCPTEAIVADASMSSARKWNCQRFPAISK